MQLLSDVDHKNSHGQNKDIFQTTVKVFMSKNLIVKMS